MNRGAQTSNSCESKWSGRLEFGLVPYLHTLLFPQTTVADLAEICDWVVGRPASRIATTNSGDESPDLKSK
jgi:hypothetical protein